MPNMSTISWHTLLEPLTELPPLSSEFWNGPEKALSTDPLVLRAEAEALLSTARQQAIEIVEAARREAVTLRAAAHQEGYEAGKVAARIAMEDEVRVEWDARKAALHETMDQIAMQIATAREMLWLEQEPEMLALTLDIARKVVKTEVQQNPEVILQVISNAIRRVTDKENVRLRISVADAPRVKEMREDLMDVIDGLRNLEIIDDRRVGEGGCVIETNAGTIDAKIETQFSEIAHALGVSEDE